MIKLFVKLLMKFSSFSATIKIAILERSNQKSKNDGNHNCTAGFVLVVDYC